jgi:hypothetical protein
METSEERNYSGSEREQMLTYPLIDQLRGLKLYAMASCLEEQMKIEGHTEIFL